jgi:hypothetical protein
VRAVLQCGAVPLCGGAAVGKLRHHGGERIDWTCAFTATGTEPRLEPGVRGLKPGSSTAC